MRHVLVLIILVIAHQAQSMTQEDIDEWMPYILNQMEHKFIAKPPGFTGALCDCNSKGKKLETSLY